MSRINFFLYNDRILFLKEETYMNNFIKRLANGFTYLRGFITGAITIVLAALSFCYLFAFTQGGVKKNFWRKMMDVE